MAIDFTVISKTNRTNHANNGIRLANLLREVRDLSDAENDAAQHMHDGSDYTLVESQFCLSAGEGANFVTRLGLLNNILNTNGDVTGANRLSQLDEFVARLAGQ
jgi:hypothetical protein